MGVLVDARRRWAATPSQSPCSLTRRKPPDSRTSDSFFPTHAHTVSRSRKGCSESDQSEVKCPSIHSGGNASKLCGLQTGLRSLSISAARTPSRKSCRLQHCMATVRSSRRTSAKVKLLVRFHNSHERATLVGEPC